MEMNIVTDWRISLKIGFKYATLSGISISISDLRIPKKRLKFLNNAEKEVQSLNKL